MTDEVASTAPDRPSSPQPWVTPTPALSALPQLDRSVSTASSVSSVSGRSTSSRLSGDGLPKRRGYMRPQATVFSDSARNRESVMSLGTIAHLQYYFARTGLLDGKGAQLAKARKAGERSSSGSDTQTQGGEGGDPYMDYLASPTERKLTFAHSDLGIDDANAESLVESPVDASDAGSNFEPDEMMMPPTVSTYKERPIYVPPPPNLNVLRRELREALDDAEKVLKEVAKSMGLDEVNGETKVETQGYYEIQGLHVLDIITLAIRAARNYYTAHEQPQRLYSIKSERQMRSELLEVMDALKRMATRNFAGGIKYTELEVITNWAEGIDQLLVKEEKKEQEELEEREKFSWREGDWEGREREREWHFLKSFADRPEEIPRWAEDTNGMPSDFLTYLQSGLQLCLLHNNLVKKSRRQFGDIKHYHTDTAKPYRCADNLRYWMKASQIRWDTTLTLDVMAVVHGTEGSAWQAFDAAILTWCKHVREELISEWREHRKITMKRTPTLKIDDGTAKPEPVEPMAAIVSGGEAAVI